jgi:hypothetical protein
MGARNLNIYYRNEVWRLGLVQLVYRISFLTRRKKKTSSYKTAVHGIKYLRHTI